MSHASSGTHLFISDLQLPFQHKRALEFLRYVKKHYRIPDENCFCVGDETDQYFGGRWQKDPNGRHSAISEIHESREMLRPYYELFPELRIAISNHGTRWQKKALEAEIPSILMRRYEEVLGAPDKWMWKNRWLIKTKRPMVMEHGDRFGTATPHIQGAQLNGISTIIGHFHSIAGVAHLQTSGAMDGGDEAGYDIWAMATGSLIDFEQYAFNYGRSAQKKPKIGVGLVIDHGRIPLWLPME
jgi:hypothetical protein